ncbi:MAG: hypothetical protein NTW86_00630 [Candidatus Sumerlaeota bacterium]|nr:hypothetical protein [Candidatus Sumerlaeota bacterium]
MDSVTAHCAELNRCNQRGGRMLSMVDLLEAETLNLDLAAWLTARVAGGDSFLVGARPGGAGKTTVMCALLNLAPADRPLVAATPEAVRAAAREAAPAPRCYVCHEIGGAGAACGIGGAGAACGIGAGPYFAYLWGADLRAYCSLAEKGQMLAANLHADDAEEAREQICGQNRVPAAHFNTFRLQVYLRVERGGLRARRRIDKVYASDGAAAPGLVFDAENEVVMKPEVRDNPRIAACRAFLGKALDDRARTIEEVRGRFIENLRAGNP